MICGCYSKINTLNIYQQNVTPILKKKQAVHVRATPNAARVKKHENRETVKGYKNRPLGTKAVLWSKGLF